MTTEQSHHHRSSLKQANKRFKGTTAAKRAENRGKVFKNTVKHGKGKQVKKVTKADRANRAHMQLEAKKALLAAEGKAYQGPKGLNKLLSFIPLSLVEDDFIANMRQQFSTQGLFYSTKQKQNFQMLPFVDLANPLAVIDQISLADICVFVVDTRHGCELRDEAKAILSLIRSIGHSSAILVVLEDESMQSLKQRREAMDSLKSQFAIELPTVDVFVFDVQKFSSKLDLFFFTLSKLALNGISWRNSRPYLMIEHVEGNKIMGRVRGCPIYDKRHLAISIPGKGMAKIVKVTQRPLGNEMDNELVIYPPEAEGPEMSEQMETSMEDDVDMSQEEEEEACSDEELDDPEAVKAPAGTSSYQASWLSDDDGEEILDDEGEDSEEDIEIQKEKRVSFNEDVEMDASYEQEKPIDFEKKKNFDDEIDFEEEGVTSARDRLKKYRAVKSLRTSEWDVEKGLPEEYANLVCFQNYKIIRKRAMSCDSKCKSISIGALIEVEIECAAPQDTIGRMAQFLLPFEDKMTLLNFTAKPVGDVPLRSKDEFLLVAGSNRMWVKPVFSEHSESNLHKLYRETPAEGLFIGSCYAPVTFDPCPVLLFKADHDGLRLVTTGAVMSNDPNRVILKRVTLSGHPFKVNKKIVVVRFMFYNPDDVNYFKPVEMVTKLKRRGHIKESLGTHGYMKCIFDKQIQHHDTVFMHLFKRVFPKGEMGNHFNY